MLKGQAAFVQGAKYICNLKRNKSVRLSSVHGALSQTHALNRFQMELENLVTHNLKELLREVNLIFYVCACRRCP